MKVLESHDSNEINEVIKENIEEKSIVFSDKSTSYVDIADFAEAHLTEKSSNEVNKTTLKWAHIAISNAKRPFLGVYHKMKGIYLQNYLDEFCYKLNRRYFNDRLFDRVAIALITCGKKNDILIKKLQKEIYLIKINSDGINYYKEIIKN